MKTPEELAEEYGATPHEKDSFLAGYQAAETFYKTRIEELETQLENAQMLATHGQEGL